ncbi:MAG: hypothetical protein KDH96_05695 [Candidatus Riesia sp.]|nr:hypothetical protein [Candidatus Riesia sp.]
MLNRPGYIFVCRECGRRSRDRFGKTSINKGWSLECCTKNCVYVLESSCFVKRGRVVEWLGITRDSVTGRPID